MSGSVNILERASERVEFPAPGGLPLIIAHRGAAASAPENTLEAFELALGRGADGVEFDIHLSEDDIPVVIHDPCLDRTTSGCGRVRDHSVRALRRLDAGSWFNQRYPSKARAENAGLKIPLLAEALAWVRERSCRAYMEIKKSEDNPSLVEAKVLEEISRAGVERQTTVISFDLPTLERCRRLDPNVLLGIDFSRPVHALAKAKRISAVSLHPHWMFVSPRFVDRAHRDGLQVLVWGLDGGEPMRQNMLNGIDGLITDNPARAVKLRAALWRAHEEP